MASCHRSLGKRAFLPGVQLLDKVVAMPVGVQHCGFVEVPQLQFLEKVLTVVVGGDGDFGGFDAIFRAPPGRLELSAIFRSPRW